MRAAKITRTALILVGPALGRRGGFRDSALYDPAMPHVLRPRARIATDRIDAAEVMAPFMNSCHDVPGTEQATGGSR